MKYPIYSEIPHLSATHPDIYRSQQELDKITKPILDKMLKIYQETGVVSKLIDKNQIYENR